MNSEPGQNRTITTTEAGDTPPTPQRWDWEESPETLHTLPTPHPLLGNQNRSRRAEVEQFLAQNASTEPISRKVILETLGKVMTTNTVDRHLFTLTAEGRLTRGYVGNEVRYQWVTHDWTAQS